VYSTLGWAFYQGAGVPADGAQSIKWFSRAADNGDVQAQFMVGYLNELGKAGAKNPPEAVNWYRKAAEAGNVEAMEALGRLYFAGDGIPADYAQAAKWYQKPAENGNTYAHFFSATCTSRARMGSRLIRRKRRNGTQWPPKRRSAFPVPPRLALFRRQGRPSRSRARPHVEQPRGGTTLRRERSAAEKQRDYIASKLNSTQLAKAQQLARDWKPKNSGKPR
jgi:hypothetical protein